MLKKKKEQSEQGKRRQQGGAKGVAHIAFQSVSVNERSTKKQELSKEPGGRDSRTRMEELRFVVGV